MRFSCVCALRIFRCCDLKRCDLGAQKLRSAPPHTGFSGPFGPRTPEESEKSAERVPCDRAPKVPKECALESQKSPKRTSVKPDFRTFLRLRGALFRHFWGPAPGYSFRTLFGLFRGSGPEGPGRPCVGRRCTWEVHPDTNARSTESSSLCSGLRGSEITELQIGGVLQYKLEVYCRTSSLSCGGKVPVT